jgi:hypothetical protein
LYNLSSGFPQLARRVAMRNLLAAKTAEAKRQGARLRPLGVLAGIVFLTAACGGSSPTAAAQPGGTSYAKEIAYAQCMRSHGEPSWPDPDSQGNFRLPASLQPSSTQYISANKICAKLLPNGGQISPEQLQKAVSEDLQFAECMRSHGITDFPDPTENGLNVSISLPAGSTIDASSPQFQSAHQACQALQPGARGGS